LFYTQELKNQVVQRNITGCQYIFRDEITSNQTLDVAVGEHCECSMTSDPINFNKTGVCPLGSQQVMYNYTNSIKVVLENAKSCHTLDRRNLKAHLDCGAGAASSGLYDTWASAVQQEFNMTHWA